MVTFKRNVPSFMGFQSLCPSTIDIYGHKSLKSHINMVSFTFVTELNRTESLFTLAYIQLEDPEQFTYDEKYKQTNILIVYSRPPYIVKIYYVSYYMPYFVNK